MRSVSLSTSGNWTGTWQITDFFHFFFFSERIFSGASGRFFWHFTIPVFHVIIREWMAKCKPVGFKWYGSQLPSSNDLVPDFSSGICHQQESSKKPRGSGRRFVRKQKTAQSLSPGYSGLPDS
jgi:hypothetical protein